MFLDFGFLIKDALRTIRKRLQRSSFQVFLHKYFYSFMLSSIGKNLVFDVLRSSEIRVLKKTKRSTKTTKICISFLPSCIDLKKNCT